MMHKIWFLSSDIQVGAVDKQVDFCQTVRHTLMWAFIQRTATCHLESKVQARRYCGNAGL